MQSLLALNTPRVIPDMRLEPMANQRQVEAFGLGTAIAVPTFDGDARSALCEQRAEYVGNLLSSRQQRRPPASLRVLARARCHGDAGCRRTRLG
jgi:hypothetical protein